MFTALRMVNNNRVSAVRADSRGSDTHTHTASPAEATASRVSRVLQTARVPILQIIFVLRGNFNFIISPEDSGVAATQLRFIKQ